MEEVGFIADTAHQQAQLPLRAGGFGLSSAVRSAGLAFVSSWALALHKKMADDFPRLGELFQAEAKDRIPLIAELASTWKSVSSLVSVLQCRCDTPKHDTLHCLITMATSAEELGEQDQDKAKDYGAPKKARHFGVGLQGRLWTKAQKKAAVALKNTAAALWSKSDSALHYEAYGRLVEAAGKSGSAWISARPPPPPVMMPFLNFPAYALISLSGVRFLCRLGLVIAGWVSALLGGFVGLGGFGVFGVLSVFSEKAIIMINIVFCILKINAGKEIKMG